MPTLINGTAGADNIFGTVGDDTINALGGNDVINASFGVDTVDGGTGTDRIVVGVEGLGLFVGTEAVDYTLTSNRLTNSSGTLNTTFSSIEVVNITDFRSGNSNVNLTGFSGSTNTRLGNGNHNVTGGSGTDYVYVGLGSSNIDGGVGYGGSAVIGVDSTSNSLVRVTGSDSVLVGGTTDSSGRTIGGTYTSGTQLISFYSGEAAYQTTVTNMGYTWIYAAGSNGMFVDATDAPLSYSIGRVLNNYIFAPAGIIIIDSTTDDVVIGSKYADALSSASLGAATLNGGVDTLTGNGGADSYDYQQAIQNARDDQILDFDSDDKLLLDHWDNTAGVVPTFIGAAAYTGVERQIRYEVANGKTYVTIDINGDKITDQTITIHSGEYQLLGEDLLESGSNAEIRTVNSQVMFYGTSSADVIGGTDDADVIRSYAGNDILMGGVGNDLIDGGAGEDVVYGGVGNDTYIVDRTEDMVIELADEGIDNVLAGASYTLGVNLERLTLTGTSNLDGTGNALDNAIWGNQGSNVLSGGVGSDQLYGGGGNDVLNGGVGNDTLTGGAGSDVLYGNQDNDILYGNQDNDQLYGGQGDDALYGGQGDDILVGGVGNDALYGNLGNDVLNGGSATNVLDGGDGFDTVTYIDAGVGVTVSLALPSVAQATGATLDTLVSIENLVGSAYSDILTGSIAANMLTGGFGADTLYGGAGADTLYGNQDNDILYGNQDNDLLYGGQGNDTIYGGQGDDFVFGGAGNDLLYGNIGNDVFSFAAKFGHDVVRDFSSVSGSNDMIRFEVGTFSNYAEVQSHMMQDGASVVISLDADSTIELTNVSISALTPELFLFA